MLRKLVGAALFVALLFLYSPATHANAGVGIDTGRISLGDALSADVTYQLPPITVYNTGNQATDYEMEVTFNETQPQHKPSSEWVSFSPKNFTLNQNEAKQVTMSITLPPHAQGGEYYAYLEAHTKSGATGTGISAAAAAKFHFRAQEDPGREVAQATRAATTSTPPAQPEASGKKDLLGPLNWLFDAADEWGYLSRFSRKSVNA